MDLEIQQPRIRATHPLLIIQKPIILHLHQQPMALHLQAILHQVPTALNLHPQVTLVTRKEVPMAVHLHLNSILATQKEAMLLVPTTLQNLVQRMAQLYLLRPLVHYLEDQMSMRVESNHGMRMVQIIMRM